MILIMANLIEISLDENTKIYIESATSDIFDGRQFKDVRNSGGIITKANDYFEEALNQIKVFANGVASSVKELSSSPNEIELEFAVKFAAEAGIVVTSLSSEANITIKLKWSDS